jgi:hypothetical protein
MTHITQRIWYPVIAGGSKKQYEIRSSNETDMREAIMKTTPYNGNVI